MNAGTITLKGVRLSDTAQCILFGYDGWEMTTDKVTRYGTYIGEGDTLYRNRAMDYSAVVHKDGTITTYPPTAR